jgi:hypothetical protein
VGYCPSSRLLRGDGSEGAKARTKGEGIMSEATGRNEVEQRLIQKSLEDDAFRQQLLEDPRATVEQELGTPVPESIEIRAVEETPNAIYLVLPPTSSSDQSGGSELSDQELESVAGGGGWGSENTQCICD